MQTKQQLDNYVLQYRIVKTDALTCEQDDNVIAGQGDAILSTSYIAV